MSSVFEINSAFHDLTKIEIFDDLNNNLPDKHYILFACKMEWDNIYSVSQNSLYDQLNDLFFIESPEILNGIHSNLFK